MSGASDCAHLEGCVSLAPDACLHLTGRGFECSRCVDACRLGSLSFMASDIRLADTCLPCGRCAAACPTEALDVTGFAPRVTQSAVVRLECARVPKRALSPGSIVLPCLGGLTVNLILELFDIHDAPVVAIDRRWCGSCPVGGADGRNWADTIAVASAWLRSALVPDSQLPRVSSEPLPVAHALELRRGFSAEKRAFLRQLIAQEEAPEPRRRLPDGKLPAAEPRLRRRQLQLLTRIAARPNRRLPDGLSPLIEVSDGCDDAGICAALCPTGALRRYEAGETSGLVLHADDCIACGRCQQACPNQAIRLVRGAGKVGGLQTLTRNSLSLCRCGARFVARGDETSCARCRKSAALVHSAALLRAAAQVGQEAKPELNTESGRNE